MKLNEYLKDEKPSVFAKRAGLPIPVVTRFLRGERGLSAKSVSKIVKATGGIVGYHDLIAELVEN